MLDLTIQEEIKKVDGLFEILSLNTQNSFVLFPSEDNAFEMPADKYFELIQQVFNNPSPLNAVCN